jgi:hypothetical protein
VLTPAEFLVGLAVAGDPVVGEDEGVGVYLLDPKDRAFGKLAVETEQVNPCGSWPGQP